MREIKKYPNVPLSYLLILSYYFSHHICRKSFLFKAAITFFFLDVNRNDGVMFSALKIKSNLSFFYFVIIFMKNCFMHFFMTAVRWRSDM